jgi:hypothetical protein
LCIKHSVSRFTSCVEMARESYTLKQVPIHDTRLKLRRIFRYKFEDVTVPDMKKDIYTIVNKLQTVVIVQKKNGIETPSAY